MGFVVAYDFTDKFDVLWQHFPNIDNELYVFTSLFRCKCHLIFTFEHPVEEIILPQCLLIVLHKRNSLLTVFLLSMHVNVKCKSM